MNYLTTVLPTGVFWIPSHTRPAHSHTRLRPPTPPLSAEHGKRGRWGYCSQLLLAGLSPPPQLCPAAQCCPMTGNPVVVTPAAARRDLGLHLREIKQAANIVCHSLRTWAPPCSRDGDKDGAQDQTMLLLMNDEHRPIFVFDIVNGQLHHTASRAPPPPKASATVFGREILGRFVVKTGRFFMCVRGVNSVPPWRRTQLQPLTRSHCWHAHSKTRRRKCGKHSFTVPDKHYVRGLWESAIVVDLVKDGCAVSRRESSQVISQTFCQSPLCYHCLPLRETSMFGPPFRGS